MKKSRRNMLFSHRLGLIIWTLVVAMIIALCVLLSNRSEPAASPALQPAPKDSMVSPAKASDVKKPAKKKKKSDSTARKSKTKKSSPQVADTKSPFDDEIPARP